MSILNSPAALEELRKNILSKRDASKTCIAICSGTGCHALDNQKIIAAFKKETDKLVLKGKFDIRETGCLGFCEKGPIVVIYPEGICYVEVKPKDVPEIVTHTVVDKKVIERLVYTDPESGKQAVHENEIPFYKNHMRH